MSTAPVPSRSSAPRVIGMLVAAGAALRFAALPRQSFWYDEAMSLRLAQQPLLDILAGRARDNGNPPLHPALLHAWTLVFGTGDAAARALSGVAGVAAIPLVYLVARRLTGDRVATLAAAIFAVSPVQIYFSQETRSYTLVTLACLASMLLLLRAVEEPRRTGSWIGFAVVTFLAMYTHYFAAFVTLAQTLWVVGRAPRDRRLLLRAGLALGLAGVAYALAWLPVLAEQARAEGNLGRAASSWYLHLASIPLVFGVGSTLLWKDAVSPVRIGAGAVAVLAFGGCAVIGIWALRRDRSALSLLLGWLFVPIVVPVLVSVALFPLFYFRYALLAAPAYDVLVAAGLVQLSPRIRAMTAGALAATSALSLWFYFTTVVKHDWRGVVAWVSAEQRPGDVLAFDADFGETAFAHYAGADSSRIRLHDPPRSSLTRYWGNAPGNEAPHSVEDRLVRAARVLLVRSHHDGGGDDHYRAVFDRDWRYVGGRAFQGIEVREYIPVAHAVTPASAGSEPGASGSPPAASP